MTHIPRYVLGSIAGLLLWFLLTGHSSEPAIWEHATRLQLASHKAWATRSTALQQAALRNRQRADSLGTVLTGLVASLDSIHPDTTPGDTSAFHALRGACNQALALCGAQVSLWRATADSERVRADLSMERLGRADSLLRVGLKMTSCRWLVVPCPSRGAMLVGGLVAGAVLGRSLR